MANEDFTEEDASIVHHIAASARDFVEFVAAKNGADVRHAVASLAMALAQITWRQSKIGHEKDAIESVIKTVKMMYDELIEASSKEDFAEADRIRKVSGLN